MRKLGFFTDLKIFCALDAGLDLAESTVKQLLLAQRPCQLTLNIKKG
jgi:hypothetical protein